MISLIFSVLLAPPPAHVEAYLMAARSATDARIASLEKTIAGLKADGRENELQRKAMQRAQDELAALRSGKLIPPRLSLPLKDGQIGQPPVSRALVVEVIGRDEDECILKLAKDTYAFYSPYDSNTVEPIKFVVGSYVKLPRIVEVYGEGDRADYPGREVFLRPWVDEELHKALWGIEHYQP